MNSLIDRLKYKQTNCQILVFLLCMFLSNFANFAKEMSKLIKILQKKVKFLAKMVGFDKIYVKF